MKKASIIFILIILVLAVVSQAQNPAPKPGPEYEKLNIWVGDWTYEVQIQANPVYYEGKYIGKSTVRPILDGYFVEFRGEDTGPAGTFHWFEVDGYDQLKKSYTWNSFDDGGGSEKIYYTINGVNIIYSGTKLIRDKEYKMRGTVLFSPDFMSSLDKREVSADGKTWMPAFECKTIKIPKGPQ